MCNIMVLPKGFGRDVVAGVVWSSTMWYTVGAMSRSAVRAGLTEGRIEW
jgi:hypothetical protein